VSGIGVVLNPNARANRRSRDRMQLFTAAVGKDGIVRQTGSLEEVEQLAHEFRQRRIDILAVCGGDGSFFRTLSAMVRAYGSEPLPQFLPLRAGSMNTIARSLRLSASKRSMPTRTSGGIRIIARPPGIHCPQPTPTKDRWNSGETPRMPERPVLCHPWRELPG